MQIVETLMAKDPKDRYASALPSALQKRSGAKLKFIRFVKFAIAGALVMTGISILVMRMSSKNPRVPNSATPWATTPPADTRQPIPPIFEWNVDPLPTTPEDKILNALDETIEVDWNGLPLEQALAELLEPIPLDYRGYATDPSRASEFESTVQLRHRTTCKQILQRVLGARDMGYIVRPSGIERPDSRLSGKIATSIQ